MVLAEGQGPWGKVVVGERTPLSLVSGPPWLTPEPLVGLEVIRRWRPHHPSNHQGGDPWGIWFLWDPHTSCKINKWLGLYIIQKIYFYLSFIFLIYVPVYSPPFRSCWSSNEFLCYLRGTNAHILQFGSHNLQSRDLEKSSLGILFVSTIQNPCGSIFGL